MRDRFIGDSLDMSKRAAAALLRCAGFRLMICPLPSQADFSEAVYRACLGLQEQDELFNPALRFRGNQREKHLSALRAELSQWEPEKPGVVILDPDKGVHDSLKSNLFITIDEVKGLVEAAKGNVVAVYHHKNAGSLSYLDLVGRFMPRLSLAYDFGAALLCFVHSRVEHLRRVQQGFAANLNPARILPNKALDGPAPLGGTARSKCQSKM